MLERVETVLIAFIPEGQCLIIKTVCKIYDILRSKHDIKYIFMPDMYNLVWDGRVFYDQSLALDSSFFDIFFKICLT